MGAQIMELPPVAAIREDLAAKNSSGTYAQQRLVYSTFMDLLPGIRLAHKPAILGMGRRCTHKTKSAKKLHTIRERQDVQAADFGASLLSAEENMYH
jgi:hypothetical protein